MHTTDMDMDTTDIDMDTTDMDVIRCDMVKHKNHLTWHDKI